MFDAVRNMIRSLGVVGGLARILALALALALAFAMPAFEGHACAAEAGPVATGPGGLTAAVQALDATDHEQTCPDCGPACAGACCHAPHMAMVPDPAWPDPAAAPRRPLAGWTHLTGLAALRPGGPDQPPRS